MATNPPAACIKERINSAEKANVPPHSKEFEWKHKILLPCHSLAKEANSWDKKKGEEASLVCYGIGGDRESLTCRYSSIIVPSPAK